MTENLTASAISMVVAGNTGITPFLTLLLVGVIERVDPDLLNMDERLESLLASDVGLGVLGLLTVLEFVSMCIPVVDETVDSVMTAVVPFISALASTSTFGLFGDGEGDIMVEDERYLQSEGIKGLVQGPWQVFLIVVGIVLALCLHGFKMIIRLFGEFWATGCITVMETIWTFCSVFVVIYIQPVSIVVAIVLLGFSIYAIYRIVLRIQKRKDDRRAAEDGGTQNNGSSPGDGAVEMGTTNVATIIDPPKASAPTAVVLGDGAPSKNPLPSTPVASAVPVETSFLP